jgi:hypothetical protein
LVALFVDRTRQNGRKRTGSLHFASLVPIYVTRATSALLAGRSNAVQGNQADKFTLAARVLGAGVLFCQGQKPKYSFISTSKLAQKWYPGRVKL